MNGLVIRHRALVEGVLLLGVPLLVICSLWLTRSNEVTPVQCLLGLALFFMPWAAYVRWRERKSEEIPVLAMISFMYFLYYVPPLFWGDLSLADAHSPIGRRLPDEAITSALLMSLLGVTCLWLGMRSQIGSFLVPQSLRFVSLKPNRLNYVRLVLIASSLLSLFDSSLLMFGEGGRNAINIVVSVVPVLAFAILFRLYLRREATLPDKILIGGFLLVRFLSGMSSGWLGVFASTVVICAVLYVAERKRIPRVALILVIAFTLFFQVGKEDFRKQYWKEQRPAGRIERMSFWAEASFSKWQEALSDPSGDGLKEVMNLSVSRLSLLTQTANVLEQTPSVVPYQYGRLYSYMVITVIPRFVWPEKPSVNDANQFYQVAYGLTREEDLEGVSIAVGVLTEGYMNFGWPGAMGIMFILGIFFGFYQRAFLSSGSGLLLTGLAIVLLPQFLSIESQMAQYLGGLLQQVALTVALMSPVIQVKRNPESRATGTLPYQFEHAG